MGKYVHEEVINGRLTVTTIKRTKEDGHHVNTLVYPGEDKDGEPEGDWIFPIPMIHDYSLAARSSASN